MIHRRSLTILAVIFLFFVFSGTEIFAQGYLVPGSYRIEYGGIYKLLHRETNRFLSKHAKEQQTLLYLNDSISYNELINRRRIMSEYIQDWGDGSPWWTRRWYESLEGGSPPNRSVIFRIGKTNTIIKNPLFTVDNSFEFRWRRLSASVDFRSKRTINISVDDDLPPIEFGWKFNFSPELSFSTVKIIELDFSETFNIIGINIDAVHTVRNVELVAVSFLLWYLANRHEVFFGFRIRLLQW